MDRKTLNLEQTSQNGEKKHRHQVQIHALAICAYKRMKKVVNQGDNFPPPVSIFQYQKNRVLTSCA
jgi:hypothetical protein